MLKKISKIFLFLIVSTQLYADSILINLENDIINGTDRHLTNSFNISYMHDLNNSYFDNVSFKLIQNIYTPEDTKSEDTKDYDIPYAGQLSVEFSLYKVHKNYFYAIGTNLGTIGKNSLAEESQTTIHKLIDNTPAKGWDNQIEKDFTYGVSALLAYKSSKKEFFFNEIELNTHIYANIGNTLRTASIGSLLRYGQNYPDNFEVIDHSDAAQLHLPQRFSDFAWSISAGVFLNYHDYIYVFDEYKDEYDTQRDEKFFGGVAYFDLYYATSRLSLSVKKLTFRMNESPIDEAWIGLHYLYAF